MRCASWPPPASCHWKQGQTHAASGSEERRLSVFQIVCQLLASWPPSYGSPPARNHRPGLASDGTLSCCCPLAIPSRARPCCCDQCEGLAHRLQTTRFQPWPRSCGRAEAGGSHLSPGWIPCAGLERPTRLCWPEGRASTCSRRRRSMQQSCWRATPFSIGTAGSGPLHSPSGVAGWLSQRACSPSASCAFPRAPCCCGG